MRATKIPRMLCMSVLVLTIGAGMARAADKPDPNIDPLLPDPEPNNAYFPPGAATAGSADPAPALQHVPFTAAMRMGQGPGCTALSPCAVDSPPLEQMPPR